MEKETARNIKLGIFVLAGTVLLILSLYFIGANKNIFGSSIKISASFYNAEGLAKGNNVRLMGIDIGTIEHVNIINDTTILVEMNIEIQAADFIKKNSIARIGTDGLMGNKLINIEPVSSPSALVNEGDIIKSYKAIETSEMLQTLYETNKNVYLISEDLKGISANLNNENSIGRLFSDTLLRNSLKQIINSIEKTSNYTSSATARLDKIIYDIKSGKGSIGTLVTDTLFAVNLEKAIIKVSNLTSNMEDFSIELKSITNKINEGDGAVSSLLNDTSLVRNLNETMENINKGSFAFKENMEALKKSFLLKKYFKKKKEADRSN